MLLLTTFENCPRVALPATFAVLRWKVVPPITVELLLASTRIPMPEFTITLFNRVAVALLVTDIPFSSWLIDISSHARNHSDSIDISSDRMAA